MSFAWPLVAALGVVALALAIALAVVALRSREMGARLDALLQAQRQLEAALRAAVESEASRTRSETGAQIAQLSTAFGLHGTQAMESQASSFAALGQTQQQQLSALTESTRVHLTEVRNTLENRLRELQGDNAKRLEEMRQTVDERLSNTLQTRLGESFKLVSERLEQVHKGLGEMQRLAAGVGDLKRVLSNVKTKGIWGETQLAALLEQVLAPEQYAANVVTRPGTRNPVDFAVKMPGRDEHQPLWLPIDAKFPTEDYDRLMQAHEAADAEALEVAARAIEHRIRMEARSLREKYVEPPFTTDFAILFLPTEGLFAEVLRRPGLVEALNRELRIVIAGPTTLFAMLNSLQMGFRTLALEKRSTEVWQVLGAVKTEFGKFGEVLAKVKNQLQTASNTIEQAQVRTRQMGRALKEVEALPGQAAAQRLSAGDGEPRQALADDEVSELGESA
ncbi:MAG TPA: DNA recombination protein RmuC [Burkholderiaceae bacterium]|nr:DNA recombination protein RmuC [Burkholderiaceae bacterium]